MLLQIPEQRLKAMRYSLKKLIKVGSNSAEEWTSFKTLNGGLIRDPNNGFIETNLSQSTRSTLNRLQTGHGRCKALLYKWGLRDNPICDCGNGKQTMHYIVTMQYLSPGFEGLRAVTPKIINWIIDVDVYLWKVSYNISFIYDFLISYDLPNLLVYRINK